MMLRDTDPTIMTGGFEMKFRQTVALASVATALIVPAISSFALAQDVTPRKEDIPKAPKIYSPYVERTARDKNFAEGLFWGDTHLHTSYSTDAGMIGNTLPPEQAYRFARGEEVITSTGQRARLIRPLDFLVVLRSSAYEISTLRKRTTGST